MIYYNLGLESQYLLSLESYYLERAYTTSQRLYISNTRTYGLARECSDATIDLAILDDYHSRDIKQTPTRNKNSGVISSSPSLDRSARDPSLRPRSQRGTNPQRQRSKVSKVTVVVDNRHINRTGRSTRVKSPVRTSFSALRNQFSSLPVEERLQFLSQLFEGALSQYLYLPSCPNSILVSKGIEREEEVTALLAK